MKAPPVWRTQTAIGWTPGPPGHPQMRYYPRAGRTEVQKYTLPQPRMGDPPEHDNPTYLPMPKKPVETSLPAYTGEHLP